MIQLFLLFFWYQVVQLVITPFVLSYLLFRKFWKKKHDVFHRERFGFVPQAPTNRKVIWLHAVSVGETLSLEYFIKYLKKEIPHAFCYLTVGTESAKKLALNNKLADAVSYVPYDFLPTVAYAYHRIKPYALIVIEAETWPNLLSLARFKKLTLFSINARLSERSKKNTTFIRPLFRTMHNCFDLIFTQSMHDKKKFEALGIAPEKLHLLGDLKAFNVLKKRTDVEKNSSLQRNTWDYTVLLVGSIHPGELSYYLNLFKELKPRYPELKMILAPRHFTWMAELRNTLEQNTLNALIWDAGHPLPQAASRKEQLQHIFEQNDILVVCVLGELFSLYPYADIFFLGGTFVPVGGHNLLEPAVWGIPTIIGPMHWHCKQHADALENRHALYKANDGLELLSITQSLLDDADKRLLMHEQSLAWLNHEAIQVQNVLTHLCNNLKK